MGKGRMVYDNLGPGHASQGRGSKEPALESGDIHLSSFPLRTLYS